MRCLQNVISTVFKTLEDPTLMNSPYSSTLRSRVCVPIGISAISSRKMVPPFVTSKYPFRESVAPVNDPFSWPKSSDSNSASESPAQLMSINGELIRDDFLWISFYV